MSGARAFSDEVDTGSSKKMRPTNSLSVVGPERTATEQGILAGWL